MFKRKASHHRSTSKKKNKEKKKNIQGLRERWVLRKDESVCVLKVPLWVGWFCLLSCLVLISTLSHSPYNIAFRSAIEKPKVAQLGVRY